MKLEAVIELEERIFTTEELLENLRAKAKAAGTSKNDGQPHATQTTSRVESLTVKIVATEKELNELIGQYVTISNELVAEIYRRVTGKAAKVLIARYVMNKSFGEIATEMNLSASRISRLHRQGRKDYYGQWSTPPASTKTLWGQETA